MSLLLSTEPLAEQEKFAFWHDVVCKTYTRCEGRAADRQQFRASTTVSDFGASQFSLVTSESIVYRRRETDVKTTPQDDLFISLMLDGQGHFTQGSAQQRHGVGDILLYDSAYPYEYAFDQAYRALLLRVPRRLIQTRVPGLNCKGGLLLKSDNPFSSLTKNLLQESHQLLQQAPDTEAGTLAQLSEPGLEMILTAFFATHRATQATPPSQVSLLNRAKQYMLANMLDTDISIEQVAQAQNISTRTLCRLFAETGESPKHWLLSQRLAVAYEQLRQRQARNVTEAALNAGFNDMSHFSKSFKKVYGYAPSRLLN